MSSANQKDTIYVDIDDEITAVIEKVRASDQKIVALVLPKRAAVLQSIVNMKLLKRTADDTKKRIVLITSEPAVLPLAGATGMYVAKTLQSKPAIPAAPSTDAAPLPVTVDDEIVDDQPLDTSRPIGEYTGDEDDTIEVDNDEPEEDAPVELDDKKQKFNRKLRVPNFERFRLWTILGGFGLVLLIVGLIVANLVLPSAKLTIKSETSTVDVDLKLTTGTSITELNKEQMLVPATSKELKKTDIEKATATGQRDEGTKASGKVTLKNCSKVDGAVTVPAGTGVSSGGLTFITAADVILPASTFTGGGTCTTPAKDVAVTAQNAGDKYNISAGRTWSVAGYSGITGTDNTDMTGGTSKIVKILSQSDVDAAKQKLLDRTGTTATDELKRQLNTDGFFMITETLSAGDPKVTSSPNVNEPASEAVVTLTTTYTVLAVRKDDVKTLVEAEARKQIDAKKQDILDDGLDKATITLTEKKANGNMNLSVQSSVTAGPQLNADEIKQAVMGKKKGDIQQLLKARPGIQDVTVDFSPFWVNKVPKKAKKITIVFEQHDTTKQ